MGCRLDMSLINHLMISMNITLSWYLSYPSHTDILSIMARYFVFLGFDNDSRESKNNLVNRVLQACQEILSNGKFITFCWIPSHRDITGNEHADRAPKDALSKAQPTHFELPCTDVFMKIQPFVSSLWQERWDKEVGNKLHAIMPQIDEKYYSGCTKRKYEVIINRLRIGHIRLTHSFRMENGDQCEGDHVFNCETYFDWMPFPEDHSSTTLWCDWFKSAL